MIATEKYIPPTKKFSTPKLSIKKCLGFGFSKKIYKIMTMLGSQVWSLFSDYPRYSSVTVALHFSKKFALHLLLHYSSVSKKNKTLLKIVVNSTLT